MLIRVELGILFFKCYYEIVRVLDELIPEMNFRHALLCGVEVKFYSSASNCSSNSKRGFPIASLQMVELAPPEAWHRIPPTAQLWDGKLPPVLVNRREIPDDTEVHTSSDGKIWKEMNGRQCLMWKLLLAKPRLSWAAFRRNLPRLSFFLVLRLYILRQIPIQ